MRITGCWRQSPGLVVVDEGVSLDGAGIGGEKGGRGGRVGWHQGAIAAGTVRGPSRSDAKKRANDRGKDETRRTKCVINISRKS